MNETVVLVPAIENALKLKRQKEEKKQTEKAFRESEEKLRMTIDNSPIGVCTTDLNRNILTVNSAYCKMLGYSREELLKMSFMDFTHPDDKQKNADLYKKIVKGEITFFDMEKRYIRKDGKTIHVFLRSNLVRDDQDNPLFEIAVVEDVTERKKAEEALKESEEKFRSVVENSHEGIFIVDNAYKFSYVNDEFCKMIGYSRKYLIGVDFRQFLEKKSKTMVAERYKKRQLGEEIPNRYGFDIVTNKGEIRTLEISASILKNTSGTVSTVGQVLDVTERNKNLKSLQEHDALNNALFEYNPIETIVVNNKGEIMQVNKAVKTNRSRLPKSGNIMYKDFASKYSIDMFEELMECIKTGKIKVFPEIKYREDRYYNATIAPFPQGAIITAQDITKQKLAQDEINRSLQEKEVLLNEIHHRVKNNMQIITSLLKLQSQNIKDKRSLELFQNSQNRVRSMALIHEKLYRTKDFSNIDFGEYIRGLTTQLLISYHILPSQIKIDVNIKDIVFNINVAIPCGLIINELVTNSLNHAFSNCREGKIKITITKKGTNGYLLVVKDNGKGLPPEATELEDPTTLGLQLVSSLVSQLKGTLQYQFKEGAIFSIEFGTS
ncbi:MAG: PAS domain S-box protein [Candidatus Cloacimonetes bacterium]|nr:PAS domain S-box protein [Candidatus Cloacimonadota bacterium]MBL7148796.1 PAS domain S-box protein [Candidatus Cloacimonadota bacterium]